MVPWLQAGLYHGLTAETAEDAIIDAVMMGGDADTIAAVAGGIAGARFGAAALPDRWLDEIAETDELRQLGKALYEQTFDVADDAEAMLTDGRLDLQI